jgi:hypothetical protein
MSEDFQQARCNLCNCEVTNIFRHFRSTKHKEKEKQKHDAVAKPVESDDEDIEPIADICFPKSKEQEFNEIRRRHFQFTFQSRLMKIMRLMKKLYDELEN